MASAQLLAPKERIISVSSAVPVPGIAGRVQLRTFVSSACGALAFSTGLAIFQSGGRLELHRHPVSEALTVVEGDALLQVEGRAYRIGPHDCAHVPAATPHAVENNSPDRELIVHTAFASGQPSRELVNQEFPIVDRGFDDPASNDPETIVRFAKSPVYGLAPGAFFTDLFARRFGAVGICGGYGRFQPGASLPCHIHAYDESITIIQGSAKCLVQGREYELSECATAYVPEGLPHRFLNQSNEEMAMIWVYAGAEPDRQIVDNRYCSGTPSRGPEPTLWETFKVLRKKPETMKDYSNFVNGKFVPSSGTDRILVNNPSTGDRSVPFPTAPRPTSKPPSPPPQTRKRDGRSAPPSSAPGPSAPSPRRSARTSSRSRASSPRSRARSSAWRASKSRSPPITSTTWPNGPAASRARSSRATAPARPSCSSASPSA